jgi:hypothetical protein
MKSGEPWCIISRRTHSSASSTSRMDFDLGMQSGYYRDALPRIACA